MSTKIILATALGLLSFSATAALPPKDSGPANDRSDVYDQHLPTGSGWERFEADNGSAVYANTKNVGGTGSSRIVMVIDEDGIQGFIIFNCQGLMKAGNGYGGLHYGHTQTVPPRSIAAQVQYKVCPHH